MKDLLTTKHVEDRLRSTMIRRAEDMAAGDGVAWDPAESVMPLSLAAAREPAAREHAVRVRPLAAVAAAVVVIAGAALGVGAAHRDGPSGEAGTAAGGSAAVPEDEEVPETTVPPTAPPTAPEPGIQLLGTTLGSYVHADYGAVVELTWYPAAALEWDDPPGSEDLQAGGYPANYWEGADQRTSMLKLFFDDGILYVDGNNVGMRADLLAFADGIRRIPGTTDFEVTPPPGYAPG